MQLLDNFSLVEKGNLSFLWQTSCVINPSCKQILFLRFSSSLKEELQLLAEDFFTADAYPTFILCLAI